MDAAYGDVMILYSDAENRRWWNGLTKADQSDLLGKIVEKANSDYVRQWAEATLELWERGSFLTDKVLASIRKWDQ